MQRRRRLLRASPIDRDRTSRAIRRQRFRVARGLRGRDESHSPFSSNHRSRRRPVFDADRGADLHPGQGVRLRASRLEARGYAHSGQICLGGDDRTILAIVLIAILCFLAGLFARTRLAQRIVAELESSVLSKVPAYEYLKQAGASVMGLGEMADHPVVLAQTGRRVADRRPDRCGRGRLGRGFRPQFSEPNVGFGLSRRRRQRPPGQRPARGGYWLPKAVRRRVGDLSKRVPAERAAGRRVTKRCSPPPTVDAASALRASAKTARQDMDA